MQNQNTLNRQYLERALEILGKSVESRNNQKVILADSFLMQLSGFLEGGVKYFEIMEEGEKTKPEDNKHLCKKTK